MTLNEWKSLPFTAEVILELKRRVESYTEELVESAGVNPQLDSYRSGVIATLKDVVDFHFDNEETHID